MACIIRQQSLSSLHFALRPDLVSIIRQIIFLYSLPPASGPPASEPPASGHSSGRLALWRRTLSESHQVITPVPGHDADVDVVTAGRHEKIVYFLYYNKLFFML